MAPAELLSWDSEFFGFPIARVVGARLSPADIRNIDEWCDSQQVRCLYLLCAADAIDSMRLAENNGYRLVDIRMTFRARTRSGASAQAVRLARAEDIPSLEAISRECYLETRFYTDPGFPRPRVAELYETWIRRSCKGWADAVLVAESEGRPAGYISCHLDSARIGLVGVSSRARGGGIGRLLVEQALGWFRCRGVAEVSVVTQARNLAAQRLYQRCGFLTHAVELWRHKWYERE